jgi:hypothetical protein
MIQLNGKTKLTTQKEKLFVEAGGGISDKSLSEDELRHALTNTINTLTKRKSPALLKIYQQCVKDGHLTNDAEIQALLADTVIGFKVKNQQNEFCSAIPSNAGRFKDRLGHFTITDSEIKVLDNLKRGCKSLPIPLLCTTFTTGKRFTVMRHNRVSTSIASALLAHFIIV